MRYCRACGQRIVRQRFRATATHAFAPSTPERETTAELGEINNGSATKEDCRQLFAEGLLVVQFPPRRIVIVHPLCKDPGRCIVWQWEAPTEEALLPAMVADQTLILATRHQIWQLPLIALTSGCLPVGERLEPISVYKPPERWELACEPVQLPSRPQSAAEEHKPLFFLLRQHRVAEIERWVWLQIQEPPLQPKMRQGQLSDVSGQYAQCLAVLNDTVGIVTPRGHWLLSERPAEGDPWAAATCVRTLDAAVGWGADFERPSVLVEAVRGRGRYRRWFYVEDGHTPGERRLRHYPASHSKTPHRAPPVVSDSGGRGLRLIGPIASDKQIENGNGDLLCASDNELYVCSLSGTASPCDDVVLGAIQFSRVEAEHSRVKMLYQSSNRGTFFGLVQFQGRQAKLALTLPIENVRGMPTVIGPHIVSVEGSGQQCQLVCYRAQLTYPDDLMPRSDAK
jgi:hypothetical protein